MNRLRSTWEFSILVIAILVILGGALLVQNLRIDSEESGGAADQPAAAQAPIASPTEDPQPTSTPVAQAESAADEELEGLPTGALIDSYAVAESHAIEMLSAVNPRDVEIKYMPLRDAFSKWEEGQEQATTFDGYSQDSLNSPVWYVSLDADEISSFASCRPPPPDVEIDMQEYCQSEPPAELIIRASDGGVISGRINLNLGNETE
jgi:hypothetical protein